MTTDELRKLDEEVHTKVMGRSIPYTEPIMLDFNGMPLLLDVPDYSTSIAAAWEVVERVKSLGWLFDVKIVIDGCVVNGRGYDLPADGDWWHGQISSRFVQEVGDTGAEAICAAALKATACKEAPNAH